MPADACLDYVVDVGAAADDRSLRRSAWVGDSLLSTPEIWFWRPGGPVAIDFVLPEGVRVSAPWKLSGDGRHLAGTTPTPWAAIVAFGDLAIWPVETRDRGARVAVVDPGRFRRPIDMRTWLAEAVDAVTTVHGRFPRSETQMLVVPSASGRSAVPWGQVLRGGAPAVHFFVNPERPLEEFRADWTASHELSHLLLPYVRRSDAWLSEGIASYYQNVARARAGMLSPLEAWRKLVQGYARGVVGSSGQRSLRDASRRMHANGDYMRVYWSGAAVALLADTALRRRGVDPVGLDDALARLAECCFDVAESWSAQRLLARLDALTDSRVFTDLYDAHIDATGFPDVGPTLERLGVFTSGESIRLDDDAPLAHIRRAIMTASDAPHRR